MKILKLKSIINNKLKNYFLYAIGELCLIVLGILLALYINNRSANHQYKKQIDNSFLRAHVELGENIEKAKETIEKIRDKDSLIYLVMNDAIEADRYYEDIKLAYLILFFHNLIIEDKAFQNLIQLNISGNRYKDDLRSSLKELYAINKSIEATNNRMSSFVYEKSLPLLAANTTSFGDLTYKGQIKKDVVDYFTTSQTYKSYVSQYAIIAIKNQLRHNQNFLKKAYDVYLQIAEEYNLNNELLMAKDTSFLQYEGRYANKELKDTLLVDSVNDSLFVTINKDFKVKLVPLKKNVYFTANKGGGYFVSFFNDDANESVVQVKLNILSIKYLYQRIDEK